MIAENIEPVQKLRSRKAERSTIGCAAVNARQKKINAPAPETTIAAATGWLSNQSFDGPSSSAYSSAPRKAAIAISPVQSNRGARLQSGLSKSIRYQAATVTMMPGGMLTRNSQCQENRSVR